MEALEDVTRLIRAHRSGDLNAYDQAVEVLYGELRNIAHRNLVRMGGNATLRTTAVVNEAYLKLRSSPGGAENGEHFLSIASKAMRQIIIDYARTRLAEKRGGDVVHVEFEDQSSAVEAQADDLLAIDRALERLAATQERLARVFEYKFFLGLNDDELAEAIGLPKRTAQRDWMKARAFLGELLASER